VKKSTLVKYSPLLAEMERLRQIKRCGSNDFTAEEEKRFTKWLQLSK